MAAGANGADPEQVMREQEQARAAQSGLKEAMQRSEHESVKGQYLERLAKSELDPDRKRILANLLSRDFILGNLTEEQAWELKWELIIIGETFYAMHPRQESPIQGPARAWLHADREAALRPLSQQERHQVDQFLNGVWMRATRSVDMKQQELMATSISESIVQRGDTEQDQGILGRFGLG
jgi:hypothetical protein